MYEEFYSFSAKPFQLTPDQKFFFNSTVHNRAMAYLRYGLEQGEGFVVITGAVGSGKTMLVRNLFQELDEQKVMAAQLVTTRVEPDDMLRMVCASFGLDHEGLSKAALLHHLEAVALARCAEGKRVLLVVDEAHNLPAPSVEELRMLSNFQVDGRSLFQSFLLGQDGLKRTLQQSGMEQVRQRIIASYHLGPLSMEETRGYIEFRMSQVGWKGDPAFEAGTYQEIHRVSRGIPRLINTLCDRLLLHGSLEQLHVLSREALRLVVREMQAEQGGFHAPEADDGGATAPAVSIEETALETLEAPNAPGEEPEETVMATPQPQMDPTVAALSIDPDLLKRVEALERELKRIKKALHHDRKLLRRAVLLQLEMDEDDDLD